jgi:hypothetical protein
MITVANLEGARRVDPKIHEVRVLQDGKPAKILLRRVVGNDFQGLYEPGCRIGLNVRLPQTAVLVNGAAVDGDIVVGEDVILDNCRITGMGRIRPGAVIKDMDICGASKGVEIPI